MNIEENELDAIEDALIENFVFVAKEADRLEFDLPRPPESMEVEPDDIDMRSLKRAVSITGVRENGGRTVIEVFGHDEQRLPWKYHRGSRHHPPEVERTKRRVSLNLRGWMEDGMLMAEGMVEA